MRTEIGTLKYGDVWTRGIRNERFMVIGPGTYTVPSGDLAQDVIVSVDLTTGEGHVLMPYGVVDKIIGLTDPLPSEPSTGTYYEEPE